MKTHIPSGPLQREISSSKERGRRASCEEVLLQEYDCDSESELMLDCAEAEYKTRQRADLSFTLQLLNHSIFPEADWTVREQGEQRIASLHHSDAIPLASYLASIKAIHFFQSYFQLPLYRP